ncbi:MAG: WGR domain-containing protein [Verrucomicrobiales bacterium]
MALGVGQSHFRCDLAVFRPGDAQYRLGILIDSDRHYRQRDLVEREVMRPDLLKAFGWNLAHVLAKEWLEEPEAVLDRLIDQAEGGEPEGGESGGEDGGESGGESAEDESSEVVPEAGETPQRPAVRHFIYSAAPSEKFWEIAVIGSSHRLRFGRVGTRGQEKAAEFATAERAQEAAEREIRRKLSLGYVERDPAATTE